MILNIFFKNNSGDPNKFLIKYLNNNLDKLVANNFELKLIIVDEKSLNILKKNMVTSLPAINIGNKYISGYNNILNYINGITNKSSSNKVSKSSIYQREIHNDSMIHSVDEPIHNSQINDSDYDNLTYNELTSGKNVTGTKNNVKITFEDDKEEHDKFAKRYDPSSKMRSFEERSKKMREQLENISTSNLPNVSTDMPTKDNFNSDTNIVSDFNNLDNDGDKDDDMLRSTFENMGCSDNMI